MVLIDVDGKGAQPKTIGELKDMSAKAFDLDERILAYEETRERQENEVLRARQEMQEILKIE